MDPKHDNHVDSMQQGACVEESHQPLPCEDRNCAHTGDVCATSESTNTTKPHTAPAYHSAVNASSPFELTNIKDMAMFCLPVLEILSNTIGLSVDDLCKRFGIDDYSQTMAMQVVHRASQDIAEDQVNYVKLIAVTQEYETNITEFTSALSEVDRKRVLHYISLLIFYARLFYKRLLQEFPNDFTEFAELLKVKGKNPEILSTLGVNLARTTLYIEEDGLHVGILVI